MRLSWVLASRNDGYGGECPGVENFAMRRLRLTLESVRRFRPGDELLAVEWCPPADRPGLAEFVEGLGVRVLTVDRAFGELLDRDNPLPRKLPFYEYLAKTIGAGQASAEALVLCNPDNLFAAGCFNGEAIRPGMLTRAERVDVARSWALGEAPPASDQKPLATWKTAGGDYTGIHRQDWARLGGYRLCHANWGCDNDLLERALAAGMAIDWGCRHLHIDHDFSTVEAPGRLKNWAIAPMVSPELVARAADFLAERAA